MSTPIEAVEAYLERTQDERLEDYIEFLRIPTIGSLAEHAGDLVLEF